MELKTDSDSETAGTAQSYPISDAAPSYQVEAKFPPGLSDGPDPNDFYLDLTPFEQVEIFAEALTVAVWAEIVAAIGDDYGDVTEIKRQLADHGWCDLFIGLVQAIEASQEILAKIPDSAKRIVKNVIRKSSMKNGRLYVTDAVVDIVVDKVWGAFKKLVSTHYPLATVITKDNAIRSLRILAVFMCPAPEEHEEVREHALKPLGNDVRKILTEKTKQRLTKLFDEWTADIHESDLAAIPHEGVPHSETIND
jgi:hypothetical protein